MTVSIVTDSTSDLPRELAQRHRIEVVPLTVAFGAEQYRDGIDITPDEFYPRLSSGGVLPTTSQPPPALFQYVYTHLASRGDVVSVHLSHKLSGTVETARNAARAVAPARISVVDTGSTSMGVGLCALAAARAAERGASRDECAAAAASVARRLHVAVALDTLEYLRRGGRLGRAQSFLGGLLRLKPVLTVNDGEVAPLARARSRQKAIDELYALLGRVDSVEEAVVLHSTTPDDAAALAERVRAALPGVPLHTGRFGPVLGVYGGPGMLGIAVVGRHGAGGEPA